MWLYPTPAEQSIGVPAVGVGRGSTFFEIDGPLETRVAEESSVACSTVGVCAPVWSVVVPAIVTEFVKLSPATMGSVCPFPR